MKSLIEQAEHAESIGQIANALDLWERACAEDQTPSALCSSGRACTKLSLWHQAEEAFFAALAINCNFTIALECMGLLDMQRTDVESEIGARNAKAWFLKAIAKFPTARTNTLLGAAHEKCGEEASARLAFEAAIELDPDYEEAYFNLANLEGTNPEESHRLLTKAIQIDPDYALAHQSLGVVEQKRENLAAAEYHYRCALELNPLDVFSRLYLANLLAVKDDDQAAEAEFRAAIAIDPEPDASLRFFANFLASTGRHAEASLITRKPSEANK